MQSHNYNGTIGHIKKIEIRQLFYCRLPLLRVRKKAASALSSNRSKVPRTTSASEPLREITKLKSLMMLWIWSHMSQLMMIHIMRACMMLRRDMLHLHGEI